MPDESGFRKFNPKATWNSRGGDNIIEDFYKPALKNNCNLYQRMAGFFTSTSFSHVTNEILDFIDNDISNAIDSYLAFLELYPQSIYYDDVRIRLREITS